MKKKYLHPEIEIKAVDLTTVICASVSFGEGTTDVMNAGGYNNLDDDSVWDW